MQFTTVFATLAAAAAVVSAVAVPVADKRSMSVYTDSRVTWYAGASLAAPACGNLTPTDNDHIVAVPYDSPADCGDWVHVHVNGRMTYALVVDRCESCPPHGIDATKAVFSELADLDQGVIENAHLVVFKGQ